MAFINAQAGRVNFQVFEFRTSQTRPSDPSFEIHGWQRLREVSEGWTHTRGYRAGPERRRAFFLLCLLQRRNGQTD